MTCGELLTALRLGDSTYPTGAFAYSWGLETLLADAQLDRAGLEAFVLQELVGRWHGVDRPALTGGWRSADLTELADWDCVIDESSWSEPQRSHSIEAGSAMLAAAVRLSLPGARAMQDAVRDDRMAGHVTTLTGALHRGAGLSLETTLLISAQGFVRNLLSAAVRLGQLGAIASQACLARIETAIPDLAQPPEVGTRPQGFAPMTDIALMRPHAARLFVN